MFQILALESWENVYGTVISCPKANIKSLIDVVHFIHIVLKTSHSSCACIHGLWLPCSFLWAGMWLMLNHSVPSRCVVSTPPSVHQVRQRDRDRGRFSSPLCSHEEGWREESSALRCVITAETASLLFTCTLNTQISLCTLCSSWFRSGNNEWEIWLLLKACPFLFSVKKQGSTTANLIVLDMNMLFLL